MEQFTYWCTVCMHKLEMPTCKKKICYSRYMGWWKQRCFKYIVCACVFINCTCTHISSVNNACFDLRVWVCMYKIIGILAFELAHFLYLQQVFNMLLLETFNMELLEVSSTALFCLICCHQVRIDWLVYWLIICCHQVRIDLFDWFID